MTSGSAGNVTVPSWIPPGFQLHNQQGTCKSPSSILWHFGLYNGISLAVFLTIGSQVIKSRISCRRNRQLKPWTFYSALSSMILQVLGMISTASFLKSGDHSASFSNLVQLWAIRPRVSWLIGNMININRNLGYQNGALDNVVVEVIIASIGCVFVGRLASHTVSHPPDVLSTWYWVTVVFSFIMLLSTAFEVIWAIWALTRMFETKGRAEAQDVDSLKWIVRIMVPLTCLSSWMIWAGFLISTRGVYCPGNIKYVDAVWPLVAVITNLVRGAIDG